MASLAGKRFVEVVDEPVDAAPSDVASQVSAEVVDLSAASAERAEDLQAADVSVETAAVTETDVAPVRHDEQDEVGLAEDDTDDETGDEIDDETGEVELTSGEDTVAEAEGAATTDLAAVQADTVATAPADAAQAAASGTAEAAAEASADGEGAPAARPEELRLLEALLFASTEPLDQAALAKRMPDGVDVKVALKQLQADYALRGVNLVRVGTKWTFRTASDLSWLMTRESTETRRLSRAAIEVLAIIAYHQPVTRAEIEDIRGVVTSKGTLDVLLETGWIRPRGRRKTPGRPLTFGTTESFLSQFSLEALGDLPGLEELKGTGLLDSRLPSGFSVPTPSDDPALREDEDPLEPGELDLALSPPDPETGAEG
jgi:segregation and condensation protein B